MFPVNGHFYRNAGELIDGFVFNRYFNDNIGSRILNSVLIVLAIFFYAIRYVFFDDIRVFFYLPFRYILCCIFDEIKVDIAASICLFGLNRVSQFAIFLVIQIEGKTFIFKWNRLPIFINKLLYSP